MRCDFTVVLAVESYIANPYWPEIDRYINILKQSGFSRCRSEDKRNNVLRRYLEQQGMTMEQFETLKRQSQRQWYTDSSGRIIIPRHQLSACLVNSCQSAPAGSRVPMDQLRSLLQLSDFLTPKNGPDRLFERYVRPQANGKALSNQRSLRSNEVIDGFDATGVISFDPDEVKPDTARGLLAYAGKYVGMGAARKMGYGRFAVKQFTLGAA